MNAKELVRIASIQNEHSKNPDVVAMANHILSTIGNDDDELLDSTYLSAKFQAVKPGMIYVVYPLLFVVELIAGAWVLRTMKGDGVRYVETRGQLRRLLEAMGVRQ